MRVWVRKYFEMKIATKIILHQNKGIFWSKRKSFTVDHIFRVLPNTHFYRKAFPEMIWSQNKHNLKLTICLCSIQPKIFGTGSYVYRPCIKSITPSFYELVLYCILCPRLHEFQNLSFWNDSVCTRVIRCCTYLCAYYQKHVVLCYRTFLFSMFFDEAIL